MTKREPLASLPLRFEPPMPGQPRQALDHSLRSYLMSDDGNLTPGVPIDSVLIQDLAAQDVEQWLRGHDGATMTDLESAFREADDEGYGPIVANALVWDRTLDVLRSKGIELPD